MFITKRKMEELLALEREKVCENFRREREMSGLYRDMGDLERRLDARIDCLLDRLAKKEQEEKKCP